MASFDGEVERSEFIMRDYDRFYRDDYYRRPEQDRRPRPTDPVERLAAVVNDPAIEVSPAMVEAINDPSVMMTPAGETVRTTAPVRQRIGKAPLYPSVSTRKVKRRRKVSNYQKTFGKNLKKLKLKHPRTQIGTLMKRAHRMTKKVLK